MTEIETQNGTVEVEEGDEVNITYTRNRADGVWESEGIEVETIRGASFTGHTLVLDDGRMAHDENIETVEVVN